MACAFGPFRVFDLGYKFRLHPVHLSECFHFSIKRILLRLPFLQQPPDFGERFLVEAAAGLAHMDQAGLFVIQAKYDRAKVYAAALRFSVSTDYGFEPVPDLYLYPFAAAALLVDAVALLSEDSFESLLASHFEQSFSLPLVVIGIADGVPSDQDRSQFLLALFQRKLAPIVAIQIEKIECVVQHGHVRVGDAAAAAGTEAGALLHQAEGGFSLLVERDHFSVEDCRLCLDRLCKILQFGIA